MGLSSWDPPRLYPTGKPTENGFIESFNGKLRDELLNTEIFFSLEEVRKNLEKWRHDYNTYRPHSSSGYRTPFEYAKEPELKQRTDLFNLRKLTPELASKQGAGQPEPH